MTYIDEKQWNGFVFEMIFRPLEAWQACERKVMQENPSSPFKKSDFIPFSWANIPESFKDKMGTIDF